MIGGRNSQNYGTLKWAHRSNQSVFGMQNIWETTENWENEAISSGLVTQRLYFWKKNMTLNGHFSRPAETDPYEEVLLRVTTCARSLCRQLNSARHECSICICICMMSALFMPITIAGLHVIHLRVDKTCSLTEPDALTHTRYLSNMWPIWLICDWYQLCIALTVGMVSMSL